MLIFDPIFIVTTAKSGGGAERSMNLLANVLLDSYPNIHLISINKSSPDQVKVRANEFCIERDRDSGFLNLIISILKFNYLVWRIRPKCLILNCDLSELFGAFCFWSTRIIAVEHSSEPWAGRKKLGKCIRLLLRSKSVTWVAVSQHLKIWPNQNKPDYVIPNEVFQDKISSSQNDISQQEIEGLVFIGRLSEEKQPEVLVFLSAATGLPVKFIGDGYLFESLKNLALNLNCENQVTFLPFMLNPWKHISSGELLIAPSRHEGDGLVVLEAIFNDVAILLADIPEFQRFHLPRANYCSEIEDYATKINTFRNRKSDLIIKDPIKQKLIDSRDPKSIKEQWITVLSN